MSETWEERMTPRPRRDPPEPTLVESCWRMVGPSNRPIECGIYFSACLELRCGYSLDDLIRTERVRDHDAGRELAAAWRQAFVDMGSFIELEAHHRG